METISSTLSNCLYEMTLNPEVQETLYQELKRAYPEPDVEYEQIKSCKYLELFFKEVMRNNVTSSRIGRTVRQNYKFPNEIEIRCGQSVAISLHSLHHVWLDPFRFDTLRFENEKEFLSSSFIPFSEGPKTVWVSNQKLNFDIFLTNFCLLKNTFF